MAMIDDNLTDEETLKDFSQKIDSKIEGYHAEVKNAHGYVKMQCALRFVLFSIVSLAYVFDWYLFDLFLFLGLVVLIFPFDFYHLFIEKLIEYNAQTLEGRQKLNAVDTNKELTNLNKRLKILEDSLDALKASNLKQERI